MANKQKTLTLFGCVPEEFLSIVTLIENDRQIIPASSWLRGDLTSLMELKDQFAGQTHRKWWIGRVECSSDEVTAQPDGWYQAKAKIIIPKGYVPFEEGLNRYSSIR